MHITEKSLLNKSSGSQNNSGSKVQRTKRRTVQNAIEVNRDANRRKSIFTRKEDLYVEAGSAEILQNFIKTSDDTSMILKALDSHFIFTSLTEEDREMVAQAMQLYSFNPNVYVFLQGKPSKSYYVIRSGSIDVIVNGRKVNCLHQGDGFGELALLHDNPRSASLKCIEPTTVWGLDREIFKKVIEEKNIQIYEQNRTFLSKVNLLDPLTPEQKDSLAASLVSRKYNTGAKIISEGETGYELFFIKDGIVSVMKNSLEVRRIYPGAYFGESALINNTPRTATCVAVDGPVKCMCLSREILQRTLNNKLQDIIEKNVLSEGIKKSPKLCLLNKDQKEAILRAITEKSYKAGDIIISSGSPCSTKMYFVMSGRIQYAKSTILFCDKGSVLGDNHVTITIQDDKRYEDDLIAGCDMKVGEITKYQFENAIGGKFENVIKENAASNVLRKVYLFSSIESSKMAELLTYIIIEKFNDTEIILREGNSSVAVYIVKRGRVDCFRAGNLINTIGKHGYFGEREIIIGESSINTYVANGYVRLWSIKVDDLAKLVNEKMKQQLKAKILYEDEDCELDSLAVIKQIGKGNYSRVYLVLTEKGDHYALKAISRKKIQKLVLYEQLIVNFYIVWKKNFKSIGSSIYWKIH